MTQHSTERARLTNDEKQLILTTGASLWARVEQVIAARVAEAKAEGAREVLESVNGLIRDARNTGVWPMSAFGAVRLVLDTLPLRYSRDGGSDA